MADRPMGPEDVDLEQALADLGKNLPAPPAPDLSQTIMERIAGGEPPPSPPPWAALCALLATVALVVGALAFWPRTRAPAGPAPGVAVYGADLTPEERAELAQLFGTDESATTDTVFPQELSAALESMGQPPLPTDKAVSSAFVTCLQESEGLVVKTQHVTRITAAAYASALLTAGIGGGSVVIAAPSSNPVTGETALVGVLKAFPRCESAQQPLPARVGLAYEQLALTVALAGDRGDLDAASAVMLKASQAVITGQAKDPSAIAAALDVAAGGEAMPLSSSQRAEAVSFLGRLADLDYGPYANGYETQHISPSEVKLMPRS